VGKEGYYIMSNFIICTMCLVLWGY